MFFIIILSEKPDQHEKYTFLNFIKRHFEYKEVSDKKSREYHQILFLFEVNINLRECGLYIPRGFQI